MLGKQPWSYADLWTAGRVQCWSRSRTCWWGPSTSSWWGSSLGPSSSRLGSCWDLGSCVIPSSCTPRRTTARPTCTTQPRWHCWWRASPSWCLCWCSRWPPTAAWPGASSWATASSPTAKPSTRTCRPPATTSPAAAVAPRTATAWRKSGSEAWGCEGPACDPGHGSDWGRAGTDTLWGARISPPTYRLLHCSEMCNCTSGSPRTQTHWHARQVSVRPSPSLLLGPRSVLAGKPVWFTCPVVKTGWGRRAASHLQWLGPAQH